MRRRGEAFPKLRKVRYKLFLLIPKLMDAARSPLGTMESLLRKADYVNWHRQQSKQHILRSQQGFSEVEPSRPKACRGCAHYHGVAYGYSRESRSVLVCGFHPYGWHDEHSCPDWTGEV